MVGSLREAPEKKNQPQGHRMVLPANPEDLFREIFSNQRGKYTYPAEPGRYTRSLWD